MSGTRYFGAQQLTPIPEIKCAFGSTSETKSNTLERSPPSFKRLLSLQANEIQTGQFISFLTFASNFKIDEHSSRHGIVSKAIQSGLARESDISFR